MSFNSPRLGSNLRLIREERGLMSKDVAEGAGLKPSHYSEIENGRRRLTAGMLERLAGAYGLTILELRDRLKELVTSPDHGRPADTGTGDLSTVREDERVSYGRMITRTPDAAALAEHLVKAMPRDEVFQVLRELTEAGEAGDEVALRKARALLELIPVTHPTTATAGG